MQRDLGTFRSIRVNNFSFFIALLLAGEMQSGLTPWGAFPFIAIMGLAAAVSGFGGPAGQDSRRTPGALAFERSLEENRMSRLSSRLLLWRAGRAARQVL